MDEPFYLVAAILGAAGLIGVISLRPRQPLIVAFIAVGHDPHITTWFRDDPDCTAECAGGAIPCSKPGGYSAPWDTTATARSAWCSR